MRKILSVLWWRIQFSNYGRNRVDGGWLACWEWSGECWHYWWDEACGMNCPKDSFREEMWDAMH
jgi:hypothetical protein